MSNLKSITYGTEGWLLESADFTVIARELYAVDSDYDWELRNRRIHAPLKKK